MYAGMPLLKGVSGFFCSLSDFLMDSARSREVMCARILNLNLVPFLMGMTSSDEADVALTATPAVSLIMVPETGEVLSSSSKASFLKGQMAINYFTCYFFDF